MKRHSETRSQKTLTPGNVDRKTRKRSDETELHRVNVDEATLPVGTDSAQEKPGNNVGKGIKSRVDNYRTYKKEITQVHGRPKGRSKKSDKKNDYWKPKAIADEAAKRAGFGSRGTADRAEFVVRHGNASILDRIDAGDTSISKAYGLLRKSSNDVPVDAAGEVKSEATDSDASDDSPEPQTTTLTQQKGSLQQDSTGEETSNSVPPAKLKAPVAIETPSEADDLRDFLAAWKAAPDDPSKVTNKMLQSWDVTEMKSIREANRIAYFKGWALNYRKLHRPKGKKVGEWEKEMESVVGKADTTLRLYMRIARFVYDNSATPLPKKVLDRPLREVPRALRNVADGMDADFKPETTDPTPEEKVERWKKRFEKLLKEAEADPDLQKARDDMRGMIHTTDDSVHPALNGDSEESEGVDGDGSKDRQKPDSACEQSPEEAGKKPVQQARNVEVVAQDENGTENVFDLCNEVKKSEQDTQGGTP